MDPVAVDVDELIEFWALLVPRDVGKPGGVSQTGGFWP